MIFLLTFACLPIVLQARGASVEDIETAYIYNFAKFIQWPDERNNRLRICVLGENSFEKKLAKLNSKALKDRKIEVKKVADIGQVHACEMLILPPLPEEMLHKITKVAQKEHILTISNQDSYAKKGVMINFYIEKKKVRFAINHRSIKKAGIRVSSKLLRVAKVVE